jgi:hypothetical protein
MYGAIKLAGGDACGAVASTFKNTLALVEIAENIVDKLPFIFAIPPSSRSTPVVTCAS